MTGRVILSRAKNPSGDVGKVARLALGNAKRPALRKAKGCAARAWRRASLGAGLYSCYGLGRSLAIKEAEWTVSRSSMRWGRRG